MKRYFDKSHKDVRFKVGEEVLLHVPRFSRGSKISAKNRGPYRITRKFSEVAFEIEDRSGKCEKVHISRINPYISRSE